MRNAREGRGRRGETRTVGVLEALLALLEVPELVDDLLHEALELAHLRLEARERLLVRDGAKGDASGSQRHGRHGRTYL